MLLMNVIKLTTIGCCYMNFDCLPFVKFPLAFFKIPKII